MTSHNHEDLEYNQQERVVYSEEWMRPAGNAGRFKRASWLHRLIVWIAGF